MGLTRSASLALGPAAGVVVATVGPGWAFAADSATFAVSAWFLARLRLPRAATAGAAARFLADLRAGWQEVKARIWVWGSIVYFGIWNLAIAAVFVLGPFVASDSLGGASSWGLIVSAPGSAPCWEACSRSGSDRGGRSPPGSSRWACALEPALLSRPSPTAAIALAAALGFGGARSATRSGSRFSRSGSRVRRSRASAPTTGWARSPSSRSATHSSGRSWRPGIGTSSSLLACAAVLRAAIARVSVLASVRAGGVARRRTPEPADRLARARAQGSARGRGRPPQLVCRPALRRSSVGRLRRSPLASRERAVGAPLALPVSCHRKGGGSHEEADQQHARRRQRSP